jgi:hypothetical protein
MRQFIYVSGQDTTMQDTTMNDDERFRKISALKGSMCKLLHTSANSRMGVRSGPLLEPRS